LAALRSELNAVPLRAAKELNTQTERLEAARFLYWHTDIPASHIAHALLGMNSKGGAASRFFERIGTFTSEISCCGCREPIICTNRQLLAELRSGNSKAHFAAHWLPAYPNGACQMLCDSCREISWGEELNRRGVL
jgi:hypothetical protein